MKDLAATNIFPGDMLLKNFGVTRHGRVVFYDYDESAADRRAISAALPEPRDEDEVMAGAVVHVGPHDIFPEEFRLFLSGNPHASRRLFEAQHADLFDHRYWQKLQAAIRAGYVFDTFPYRRRARFPREDGDSAFTYDMAIRAGDIP